MAHNDYDPFASMPPPHPPLPQGYMNQPLYPPMPPHPPPPIFSMHAPQPPRPPLPPPPPPPSDGPPPPPPPPLLAEHQDEDPQARSNRLARIASENVKKRKHQYKTPLLGMPKKSGLGIKGIGGRVVNAFNVDSDEEEAEVTESLRKEVSVMKPHQVENVALTEERRQEIRQTAEWLNANPEHEATTLERSKGNQKFSFLFEKDTPEGEYFLEVRSELLMKAEVQAVCSGEGSLQETVDHAAIAAHIQAQAAIISRQLELARNAGVMGSVGVVMTPTPTVEAPQAPLSSAIPTASSVPAGTSKPRKNRWGPAVLPVGQPIVQPVVEGAQPHHNVTALPEHMDEAALKQLRDQKEMQLLQQRARDVAATIATSQTGQNDLSLLHEERVKAYSGLAEKEGEEVVKDTLEDAENTGGIIEGGTWEHRKRAKEMLATADSALGLTLASQGTHHVADFLPKEELDLFLKNSKALAAGEKIPLNSFENEKLDTSNVGYQMLKQAGWEEGSGLGSQSSGIVDPIALGNIANDSAGVGVLSAEGVQEGDNEFDQYRKRMMLAYRFRPNPLNNPRRDYY